MSNIQNAVGQLQYFVGKLCTVFTVSTNNEFKAKSPEDYVQQLTNYFTGTIQSIDEVGINMTQLRGGLRSYFFIHNVVGIAEEKVLNPQDEKDAELLAKIQGQQVPNGIQIVDNPSPEQQRIVEEAQEALDKQQGQAKQFMKNMVSEAVTEQLGKMQSSSDDSDSIDVEGLSNLSKALSDELGDPS